MDALIKQDKELRNSGYTRDIAEFDNLSNLVSSDEISILDHSLAQILVERVTDLEPRPSDLLDHSQWTYAKPEISGEKAQQLWNEWVAEAERLLNA